MDALKKFWALIGSVSLGLLAPALLLGLAPFTPEPHVVEKVRMLLAGTLSRPIDIFDLLMHGTPVVFIALKLIHVAQDKIVGKAPNT